MHAEKKAQFFPILSSEIFTLCRKKIGQKYQSLQKGGTLTNWFGRLSLNNLSLHIRWVCICPPSPLPSKLNRKTNFSQVCCWWAKFWSKWMFRQENILSGSTLDLLLEHFSGFLSYIFLRWTLCIQKPLFH